jgi:pimeloyl-ACP methyl ester carboxylesterase
MNELGLQHRFVQAGQTRLHIVTAGPPDGRLVVLLHGFPARWSTWRATMAALAGEGFFVVAPDLRGYGESERPTGVASYSITAIVEDVAGLIRALDRPRAFVAGHDFGGGVTWALAMTHPELVERMAVLNSVHPVGMERQMRTWSQLKKSWYVFFFLLPWIPEWLLGRRDLAFLRSSLQDDGLSPEVAADVLEGVHPPGALHAALQWYRASFRDVVAKKVVPVKVDLPVLSVWGDRERHLDAPLAVPPADWVSNVRVEHVPEGGHWVHHDAPERVAALLAQHFGG